MASPRRPRERSPRAVSSAVPIAASRASASHAALGVLPQFGERSVVRILLQRQIGGPKCLVVRAALRKFPNTGALLRERRGPGDLIAKPACPLLHRGDAIIGCARRQFLKGRDRRLRLSRLERQFRLPQRAFPAFLLAPRGDHAFDPFAQLLRPRVLGVQFQCAAEFFPRLVGVVLLQLDARLQYQPRDASGPFQQVARPFELAPDRAVRPVQARRRFATRDGVGESSAGHILRSRAQQGFHLGTNDAELQFLLHRLPDLVRLAQSEIQIDHLDGLGFRRLQFAPREQLSCDHQQGAGPLPLQGEQRGFRVENQVTQILIPGLPVFLHGAHHDVLDCIGQVRNKLP
jgi:hypothetical protein